MLNKQFTKPTKNNKKNFNEIKIIKTKHTYKNSWTKIVLLKQNHRIIEVNPPKKILITPKTQS